MPARTAPRRGTQRCVRNGETITDGADRGCFGRLKDYVLASMMWDPTQNPDALISEFLIGYYSELGAPFVRKYMDTMHAAVSTHTCGFCCLGDARGTVTLTRLELS